MTEKTNLNMEIINRKKAYISIEFNQFWTLKCE